MTIPEFQFFVPWSAFLYPAALAAFGLCLLTCFRTLAPRSLLFASAFPCGAALAGLIQLTCSLFGYGDWTRPLLLGTFAVCALTALIRRGIPRPRLRSFTPSRMGMAAMVLAALTAAVLLTQSNDLGEKEPLWQIALRAKILATYPSLDNPFFTDERVFHHNRGYPLLLSAIDAVVYRFQGDVAESVSLRTIPFGYFTSYLVLLLHWGWHRGRAGLLLVATGLSIPAVWRLGVDQAHLDFPYGLSAVLALLWLLREESSGARTVSAFLLTAAVLGFKQEGYVLIGITGAMFVLGDRGRPVAARFRKIAPLAAAGLLMLVLHRRQIQYCSAVTNLSNISIAQSPRIDFTRIKGLWFVWKSFVGYALLPKSFGAFFVLAACAVPFARTWQARLALAIAGAYLAIIISSFTFVWAGGSPFLPMLWSSERILTQMIPLLLFVLSESVPLFHPPHRKDSHLQNSHEVIERSLKQS